jgi:enolase
MPSSIESIVEKAGYTAGKDIFIGIDAASSEFYENGTYNLASENRSLTSQEFTDYLANWVTTACCYR